MDPAAHLAALFPLFPWKQHQNTPRLMAVVFLLGRNQNLGECILVPFHNSSRNVGTGAQEQHCHVLTIIHCELRTFRMAFMNSDRPIQVTQYLSAPMSVYSSVFR